MDDEARGEEFENPEPEATLGDGIQVQTLMEQLQQRHQEIASSTTTDMPLPGYEDLLLVRYRILDVKNEINRITQKVAKEGHKSELARALYAALDTMATACVEILVVRDGEEPVPLAQAFGSDHPPVKYDQALAEFVGLEAKSARETILALFGGNEPMIMTHIQRLSRWMSTSGRSVGDAFMGEM